MTYRKTNNFNNKTSVKMITKEKNERICMNSLRKYILVIKINNR